MVKKCGLALVILFLTFLIVIPVMGGTSVSYEDLLRKPDKYIEESYFIQGTVIQSFDITSSFQDKPGFPGIKDVQQILLSANYEAFSIGGNPEVYRLLLFNLPLGSRVLEKDVISGEFSYLGLYTYDTADGVTKTIPEGMLNSGEFL